ncbi:MAG: hypothetical protein KF778_14850 [Rhodocyclaceae bacterium]|nr:hypothetical protein [Rhodocyclaceae bacterium]
MPFPLAPCRRALLPICAALVVLPVSAQSIPTSSSYGLDGMAPAGHWAARLTLLNNGYTTRFDAAGRRVDLDAGIDGLNLAALGLAGTLRLDTEVRTEYTELMFGYGLSADLTVGAIVPYARTTTRVRNFAVEGGIGRAGLQSVLSGVLGYKPLATTRVAGYGDPTVGVLWRFHRSEQESAIAGAGVRFGVARPDDPDNLLDIPPGDGTTDLRARLEYFRDLGSNWDMRLLGEFFRQLPDQVTLRPGNPLTTVSKESLRRKMGDYYETDVELGRRFGDLRLSATWHRYRKGADHYSSALGTDTRFLNANTDTLADQLRLALTWSGVDAWRAGKLAAPLIVKLEMQDARRGRNFVGVRDIYLRFSSFF